ncbi:hypothetical protein [Sedimentitalea sp.]|uniref:nSTAND1 domain-containing NTPase n=1 Tax=Sedimentitalea sp. TaxID=2048915 RepID=UPI0032972C76
MDTVPVEMTAEWQIIDLTSGLEKRSFSVQQPTEGQSRKVRFSEDGLKRLKIGLRDAGLDPKFFAWPPEGDANRSPYRGLKAIDEEDAGIFFGREGPIVEGLDHLRGLREAAPPRMFVILGASGAGKSSYMRAGLLPRLRRDSRHFRVLPVIRPNRAVLEGDDGLIGALEGALRDVGQPTARSAIRNACQSGAEALATLLAPLVATADADPPPPALVLSIDQGEELFQADGAEEAQAFLGLLNDLLALDNPSLIALVTIRSDSYEPLQSARALEGIRQRTYSLPPMPRGAYSEVILGPVRRLVESTGPFVIEDTLVEALLGDIDESDAKDSLPLLAFTLERLYRDEGGDGDLKLSEYEATGRIRGAIEAAVKQVLTAADSDPRIPRDRRERLALLRRAMIPALAGVDPDTGTPRCRVERMTEIPAEARPLVDLMVDQRLLATDVAQETGETTVEPAHEALLRQWDLLNSWLGEEAEDLGTAESTRRAARDWQANAREDAWLAHAGTRLQQAETVAARVDFANLYGPVERAYLAACRKAEETRRAEEDAARQRELDAQKKIADEQRKNAEEQRNNAEAQRKIAEGQRTRQKIFAGAFAVSLVLLGLAGWQWREAITQAKRADTKALEAEAQRTEAVWQKGIALEEARAGLQNQRLALAALSDAERMAGRAPEAAVLALAAWPRRSESETELRDLTVVVDALSAAIVEQREATRLEGHRSWVRSVAFSPDATLLATGSDDGTARLWNLSTGAEVARLEGHGDGVRSVAFSTDGTLLATGSADGTAWL